MSLNPSLTLADFPESARRGMRSPRVVTLYVGEMFYRFASTARPSSTWAAGPWWVREADYRTILAAHTEESRRHGARALTLGFLSRVATAVQQSYSRVDAVVKASVINDVKAFAGAGRTQYNEELPNGFLVTMSGWPNIEQIFIPNIGDRSGRTMLGYQALRVIKQKVISSQQLY